MRTLTATALALAVSMSLGSAAFAGEGVHKDKDKERHADHSMMKDSDRSMMKDSDRSMMKDSDRSMMKGSDQSMRSDESAGTNMQTSSTQASSRGNEGRIDTATSDRLAREFRQLDRDSDGAVLISDLDNNRRAEMVLFDVDDNERLDRYEFQMANTARFTDLDRNKDGQLSRSELDMIKPEFVSFVALDSDNDQQLSKQEYRQFIESGDWVRDRDRYAFDNMDRDSSGNIDNKEASVYVPLASRFTAYDPDGDGLIESTEYEVFLAEVDAEQQRGNRMARSEGQLDQDQSR